MKAWRFYGLGDMRLDEVEYPGNPKPGWITLKVKVVQPSITEAVRARGGPTMDGDFIKKMIEEHAPIQLLMSRIRRRGCRIGQRRQAECRRPGGGTIKDPLLQV